MPFGPGLSAPEVSPGPIAPTHRPRWLLVLSSITLMYGGLLLISGLGDLRNPTSAAKLPMARPMAPAEEAQMRALIDVNTALLTRHARTIRIRAAASTVLALILLYSAAAALSRDRHGRTATLTAAWLGIAFQLGGLPAVIPIAEDYAATSAPLLAQMFASDEIMTQAARAATGDAGMALTRPEATDAASAAGDGGVATTVAPPSSGQSPPRPEEILGSMHALFIGLPIATATLGILVSLLLIRYFGGRRGRALYGILPGGPPPRR